MDMGKDRSQEKMVKVFSTQDEMQARMIQEVLANAGIECMINSEAPANLFPMNLGNLGRQDILVLESAEPDAARILSELPEPDQIESNPDE